MFAAGAEDGLNLPELRRRVEPTVEDQLRIRAIARNDVLPRVWQAIRRLHSEEMAACRSAESVEVFVRPQEHRLGVEVNTRLFANLARHCLDQVLSFVNAARGYLRSRVRMISVVEDKKLVVPFDVDDNSLPQRHPIYRKSPGRRALTWASISPIPPTRLSYAAAERCCFDSVTTPSRPRRRG